MRKEFTALPPLSELSNEAISAVDQWQLSIGTLLSYTTTPSRSGSFLANGEYRPGLVLSMGLASAVVLLTSNRTNEVPIREPRAYSQA